MQLSTLASLGERAVGSCFFCYACGVSGYSKAHRSMMLLAYSKPASHNFFPRVPSYPIYKCKVL